MSIRAYGCLLVWAYLLLTPSLFEIHAAAIPKNSHNDEIQKHFATFPRTSDGRLNLGDVIISKREEERGAIYRLWPNARLVYVFASNVTLSQQQAFLNSCQRWSAGTPLVCVQRTNEAAFFTVQTRTGTECDDDVNDPNNPFTVSCTNGLGPPKLGPRTLNIHSNAWNDSVLLDHELGHIIGLIHEQQRADRNNFILFYARNVRFLINGKLIDNTGQFWQYWDATSLTDYDYFSIMHYWNCAFTAPGSCTDAGDPNRHAITPLRCDRMLLGYPHNPAGPQITTLDKQGVQRAYMGRLLAALKADRYPSCPRLDYTPKQVAVTCGEPCAAASRIEWRKANKRDQREWCRGGFVAKRDPVKVCSQVGQEFKEEGSSSTKNVIDKCPTTPFNSAILDQDWVVCGCRWQRLNASCVSADATVTEEGIKTLLASSYGRDRAAGRVLAVLNGLSAAGAITPDAVVRVREIVFEHYIRNYFGTRGTRLARALRSRATIATPPLSVESIDRLAQTYRLAHE